MGYDGSGERCKFESKWIFEVLGKISYSMPSHDEKRLCDSWPTGVFGYQRGRQRT